MVFECSESYDYPYVIEPFFFMEINWWDKVLSVSKRWTSKLIRQDGIPSHYVLMPADIQMTGNFLKKPH